MDDMRSKFNKQYPQFSDNNYGDSLFEFYKAGAESVSVRKVGALLASIEPVHWVIKTGHGTHYRDTPPPSDVVVNWTPLFTSPQPQGEQKQVSSFTKESWDAFEYQFDRDSSNDNVTEALKAVWECLTPSASEQCPVKSI